MIQIREYVDETGNSPFRRWFVGLHAPAAAKVAASLERMAAGNFSNAKTLGAGVSEYRIDFGPGYRIYFGRDGDELVVLLAGGSKKRQPADIEAAKANWTAYKKRKRQSIGDR